MHFTADTDKIWGVSVWCWLRLAAALVYCLCGCSGSLWLASGAGWKKAIDDFTEAAVGQRDGKGDTDGGASLLDVNAVV